MGRRKRNPCVQKGATACPDPGHTAPAWRIVSHPPRRRLSAIERCSDRAVVTRWWRSETGSVNNHPRNDERRGLSLDWPATSADEAVSRRRQCLSGVGRGAESTMRAQAVAATMIAPATATVSRQPSADMPDAAGDRTDDDRCDRSRTAVIGGKPCGDASEEWKRIDRQGEQQPAEICEADKS